MLVLLRLELTQPPGMPNAEFYRAWLDEAQTAEAGLEAGVVRAAWKVAGRPEIVAILDVYSADNLDHAVLALPFWRRGMMHVARILELTPLREYGDWVEDLRRLAGGPEG